MPLTTLIDIINQISWSTMGHLIEGNTHFMIINICHGKKRRLKSNIKKWNEIKSYPKLPLLCTERRERFSIRTFLYRPATIVITLITRTPQPHHKTGYHSESLLIKSKHSLGFNFNFSECTLDGAAILWLEKHIWNHFFHCAEHAGAQMV